MNILYIHGWKSSPNAERLRFLESKGHQTFALHLDYETETNTFEILKQYAIDNEIDFIVGSSAGGYIGYWLGQFLNIPQLLFNPAVAKRSIEEDVPYKIEENFDLKSWVILGMRDDTVPHEGSLSFFNGKPNRRIIICEWLVHRIDFQTFRESVEWCFVSKN